MTSLLAHCEDHSLQRGYRWNPTKCVALFNSGATQPSLEFSLYGQPISAQSSFSYLGVPIKPGDCIDNQALISKHITKANLSMNSLASLGVNPSGFSRLTALRFYTQIVRAQLEYGLVISSFISHQITQLEKTQNSHIRRIYGGSKNSSIKVMRHFARLPSMQERLHILQTRFFWRAQSLPDSSLLPQLLPYISDSRLSQWYKLSKNPLWRHVHSNFDDLLLKIILLQNVLTYNKS
jgi:hypothetical protein